MLFISNLGISVALLVIKGGDALHSRGEWQDAQGHSVLATIVLLTATDLWFAYHSVAFGCYGKQACRTVVAVDRLSRSRDYHVTKSVK